MNSVTLDSAHRALAAAALLLDNGFPQEAASRAYYAAFYAARAVLQKEGEDTHTHKGVVTTFNRLFVRTDRVSPETGRMLGALHRLRTDADYDDHTAVTGEEARDALELARRFVAAVEPFVESGTPPTEE